MAKGELVRRGILYRRDGLYIIRQAMPYPLAENNVFLAESIDGWTVVDVGVDLPLTRQVWQQALTEIGIHFKQIRRIIITHCHPDHLGAAAWLQRQTGAPVFMLAEEIDRAREFIFYPDHFTDRYRAAIAGHTQRAGFDRRLTEQLIEDWHQEVAPLFPCPDELLALNLEAGVEMQGHVYQIIPAPVHADGQFLLWNSDRRHMLAADLISLNGYLHFSDWPNSHLRNPLQNLFVLHNRLRGWGDFTVLPGHGPVFTGWDAPMEKLLRRHQNRLDKICRLVNRPISPAQLYPQLYDLVDYVHLHRVAIGETLGYLEELCDQGKFVRFEEQGQVWYAPNH